MANRSVPQPNDQTHVAMTIRLLLLQRLLAAYAVRMGVFTFSPN